MENFKEALNIIQKIEDLGYAAYIVGGAVRDNLLGLDSFDIDIATSMPIDILKNYFKILDNGSSYLSVTILVNDNQYEITNFRTDISYSDHRHPEVKIAPSFYIDSFRRDFTINAIAYDKNMRIVDYHNGVNDLNNKLIRTIGNPYKRFEEDALRILRGLYLVAKLNFSFEDETLKAIIDKKELLSTLSDERIYPYFSRIINGNYKRGIDYINKYNLFSAIPTYSRWLLCAYKGLTKSELIYSYYLKYKKIPLNLSYEKKICRGLDSLINSGFSKLALYKNLAIYNECKNVLKYYGYNILEYDKIINTFVIKKDTDLAVCKEEIASYFDGGMKSIMIDKIIEMILEGKISNNREEILEVIRRF